MEEGKNNKKDFTNDRELQDHSPGKWFSNWEEQCLLQAEAEAVDEAALTSERRTLEQKLWLSFQTTASAIAQLYKDRAQSSDDLWVSFQSAAEFATNMYKDSVEGCKNTTEVAAQRGYHRRNKEVLSWAKKKRRHIRREDLIGYLCGRSPPHRGSRPSSSHRPQEANRDSRLQTFREAVSMNGLNGAMADISFGGDSPLRQTSSRNTQTFHPDLPAFLSEEFQRRNDRLAPSSPSRKRAAASGHDSKPSSPKRRK
ncbi:HUWE1-associated protein modifying stress responses 1-like [Ciona intestinalis]